MLQVSFIPPQTIWRALLVGRYVRIVSSLLRRWKTRNSKSRIDLAGSSGPLLDGLTVSPIRMGSRRFADSLVCEYSVIKKNKKKEGRSWREKEWDSGWGKEEGREGDSVRCLSVGNRRRDEMLDVCRSLGGPRLPVLTLLGSISREAKQ